MLDIKVAGIVLDKEYGQWNLIGTIHTSYSSEEIDKLHALRDDTYEVNTIEFVPFAEEDGVPSRHMLKEYFPKYLQGKIWGMALAVIYAALLDVGFSNRDIYELSAFPYSLD